MVDWIKRLGNKISNRGGIFMFIRAQFSSQISSLTDFTITIILANVVGIFYGVATFCGSLCGGVVNCMVNYQWTFKAQGVKKKYVFIKYVMVWICSLTFNTVGTVWVTELLKDVTWIESLLSNTIFGDTLGDLLYLIPKIVVSLIVGWGWNYNMQRLFVYKDHDFKKYFKRKETEPSETKDN